MTDTVAEERDNDERAWRERVASAIELVAARLGEPERALVSTLAHQEELLKEFVALMVNPNSTNQEWADLLEDVRKALGLETTV